MSNSPDLGQTCTPRDDVLSGELSDAVFAANLDAVVEDDPDSPESYRDAGVFFDVTHPSQGLRDLLNESLGRISGNKPGAAPVIRLETSLGGGKTHNLVALWHAARGRLDPPKAESGLMDSSSSL
jgi:predicted AAA+ superfamily ATPase